MAGEQKKISFGFSKSNKKTQLANTQIEKEENTVEFVSCMDNNSIKLLNGDNEKKKELPVIPMKVASTLRESIINTLNSRKSKKTENGETKENVEEKPLTLDEMAAKEIMDSLKESEEKDEKKDLQVPLPSIGLVSEKEATLDDYENMPISDFGLAMLRGMGWDEKKGIGLNEKIVKPVLPDVRPKGMGLGADRAMATNKKTIKNEDLVMKKGAFVKVTTGPHSNLYGKIEGFDELPGRIVVKLAPQNNNVSLSEFMVELVPQSEYNKNSKVMNIKKFNEFTEMDNKIKLENEDVKVFHQIKREVSPPRKSRYKRSPSESSDDLKNKSSRHSEKHKKDKYKRDSSESPDDYRSKKKHKKDRSRSPSEKKHKRKHKKHKSGRRSSSNERHSRNARSPTPKKHRRRHRSRS